MPNIVDALIVTLGLDSSDFKKGTEATAKSLDDTKRRANDAAKGITESQTKAQQSFAGTGKHATGAAGDIEKSAKRTNTALRSVDVQASTASKSIASAGKAMLAPFAEFAIGLGAAYLSIDGIKKAISQAGADSAIGRAAQMSGIPVAEFSTFGAASKLLGGDSGAAMGTLASLAQQQQAASLGQISPAMALLESLGIKPNQPVPDLMKALNRRLQGMTPARQSYILNQLGVDSGTAYLEEQSPAKYDATMAKAAKDQITPGQFNAEQGVTGAYSGVIEALDNLGRDVTVGSAPALIQMLAALTNFVTWVDAHGAKWFYDHFSNQAITKDVKGAEAAVASVFSATAQLSPSQHASVNQGLDILTKAGLTRAQAAGVLGNAQAESSFNSEPGVNLGNPHYGLFQWSNSRRQKILSSTGIDVANATPAQQYQAALWEMNNDPSLASMKSAFKNNPNMSPQEAAQLWNDNFEKPGGYNPARGAMAANIYNANGATMKQKAALARKGHSAVWNAIASAGGALRSAANTIENHINVTVHAPSGDPHAIAHVVKRELQKQTTQAKNAAPGSMQ